MKEINIEAEKKLWSNCKQVLNIIKALEREQKRMAKIQAYVERKADREIGEREPYYHASAMQEAYGDILNRFF